MTKQLDYHTVFEIFERFSKHNAAPKGELYHINAYTLLVAVVLSAQATDAGVNKATKALFAAAPSAEKMLELGLDAVTEHIKTIGLFRQKAKNIITLSQILTDDYKGIVPASRAALESLPGVGRKTANVVLNVWHRHPAQAVDTHIFRLWQSHGCSRWRGCFGGGTRDRRPYPRVFPNPRPSLDDFTRAVCLQSPQTPMRPVFAGRFMPI